MARRNLAIFFGLLLLAIIFTFAISNLPSFKAGNQTIPQPANLSNFVPISSGCGNLEIYFLNVSQADSTLIITPKNKTILIDAGSAMKKNSSSNMIAFLKSKGISQIDTFIATHYHEDHIGGSEKLFSEFDVKSIYENGNCGNSTSATSKEFRAQSILRKGIIVEKDMVLPIDDDCITNAKLIVAYDRPQGYWLSNENENSILVRIVYGNISALIAGDCGEDCEAELINQGTNLGSSVLRIGHHGSSTSSSNAFLAAVNPTYSVLSTDYQRSITDGYFHPRSATLERIYKAEKGKSCNGGVCVFRTDLNGNIRLITDGSVLEFMLDQTSNDCDIFSGYSSSSKETYGQIPSLIGNCN